LAESFLDHTSNIEMQVFFDFFSTREISSIFWTLILVLWLITKDKIRISIWQVVKSLFSKRLILIIALSICYITLLLTFLYNIGFWDKALLKDSIFWFFTISLGMFFNVYKIENSNYFKDVFRDIIKWTIFLEFIINFYTFNLATELILMPVVMLLGATKAHAEALPGNDKRNLQAINVLKNTLAAIGTIFIFYSLYKTITNSDDVFTAGNLKSFLFTPILTILYLPFIYFLALFVQYQSLFAFLKITTKDIALAELIKKRVIRKAKFNLIRLMKVKRDMNRIDFGDSQDARRSLDQLLH
jgi:hypothetical protein